MAAARLSRFAPRPTARDARRLPSRLVERAALALVLTALAAAAVDVARHDSAPVAVGHRGIPARLPENTVAGFRHALSHGAPVELDVRLTADGVPVVIHDAVVPARCTSSSRERRVRALPFAALRTFDCGAADPAFPAQRPAPGARVPSLAEVLALDGGPMRGPAFLVELKADDAPPAAVVAAAVAAVIEAAPSARGRVVVESFSPALVAALQARAPGIARGLLVDDARDVAAAVSRARSVEARLLSPSARTTTRALVAAAHDAHLAVAPYTVNDDDEWRRLASLGVDAVVTDDPLAPRRRSGRR